MLPSAVGGDKRLNGSAKIFESACPLPVGAGLRPGCTAKCEDDRIRLRTGAIRKRDQDR